MIMMNSILTVAERVLLKSLDCANKKQSLAELEKLKKIVSVNS